MISLQDVHDPGVGAVPLNFSFVTAGFSRNLVLWR